MVLARVPGRDEHALGAPQAEAAGDDYAVKAGEQPLAVGLFQLLGVYPVDVHLGVLGPGGVAERLGHGEVGVVELHILADEAYLHAAALAVHAFYHGAPLGEVRLRGLQPQLAAHDAGEARLLEHQRRLIERGQRDIADDAVLRDVAEARHLAEDAAVLYGLVAAQHNNIRRDSEAL